MLEPEVAVMTGECPGGTYHYIYSAREAVEVLRYWTQKEAWAAIDVETGVCLRDQVDPSTGETKKVVIDLIDPWGCPLYLCSVSVEPGTAVVFDMRILNKDPEFVAELEKKNMKVGDDGGLYYAPVASDKASPAGLKKIAGKDVIQSYGAMTYDGIKTYIYAGFKKDSPEVKAAMDWVRKNYELDIHPGFAYEEVKRNHLRGIYYYYLLMARALDVYGENPLETFDGKKHDWPKELAGQFLKVVRESKMWQNDNASWYESDPVVTTAYVLMTCDILFKYVK